MYSRSASSWPTLPQIAITSRFFSTCSHFRQHEVSRPPEYASTTFSFSAMVVPFSFRRQGGGNFRSTFSPCVGCVSTPIGCSVARKRSKIAAARQLRATKNPAGAGCCHVSNCIATKIRDYLIRTADNTRARRSVFRRLWRRREALVKLKNIAQLLSLVSSLQAMIAGFPATPVRWSVTVRIFEACVNCNPNSQNSRIF